MSRGFTEILPLPLRKILAITSACVLMKGSGIFPNKVSPKMILPIIKKVAQILTGFVILSLIILALWKVPEWQVANLKGLNSQDLFDKENEARTTLAQIVGGFALLFGIYLTWRRISATEKSLEVTQGQLLATEKNLEIARDGQITERFSRAIEQLGDEKLEVRMGGIYALERIAHDSEKDH